MWVGIEENLTRGWYYHCLRPKGALQRLWQRFLYGAVHRWIIEYNFSRQDERVMLDQRYDTPEKLSGADAGVLQWRRPGSTNPLLGRRRAPGDRDPPSAPAA